MCLPGTVETVRAELARGEEPESGPRLSRRAALAGGAAVAAGALLPGQAAARARVSTSGRVQDLTHVLRPGFPTFSDTDPPIEKRTIRTIAENGFYAQAWSFGEHSGTHVDAPGHFVRGERLVTALRPAELIAPAAVVDISRRARRDADATVEVADLRRYERRHGRIPRGALVLMDSGWDERADDPQAFRNPDAQGTLHFPGFSGEAVEWLLERRRIRGLGVDTLSLDPGESTTFEAHLALLGADRYGIEGLANLGRLPREGAEVIVGVIPWEQGSGGPARVLATY
jgi:kynurenine formamidase